MKKSNKECVSTVHGRIIRREKKTLTEKITKLIKNNGLSAVLGEIGYVVSQDEDFDCRYNMILASNMNHVNHLYQLIEYEGKDRERKG